jgi:hypothetical protein
MDDFLQRKKRKKPPVAAKVDGEFEAHLIQLHVNYLVIKIKCQGQQKSSSDVTS